MLLSYFGSFDVYEYQVGINDERTTSVRDHL